MHIVDSTFYDMLPAPGSRYVRAWGNDTAAALSGCRFDNSTQRLQQLDGAVIYSDDSRQRVFTENDSLVRPPLPSAAPGVEAGEFAVFKTRNDPWFSVWYQVRGLMSVVSGLQYEPGFRLRCALWWLARHAHV